VVMVRFMTVLLLFEGLFLARPAPHL
jgi:hypothetical protein